ncbi:MAG TPA: hypothetical protein VGK94_07835 [Candidatus Polarisedimenticolia bacterium]
MARTKDFDRFVSACDYPGLLDEEIVSQSLAEYLAVLGVKREIRRLPADWDLDTEEPLRRSVWSILDDVAARAGRKPPALDARDALDAGDGALRRFTSWCIHRTWLWWSWDLSWITTTLIGAQQLGRDIPWARPLFEAYIAGCWMLYWTDDTLYWIAKPTVHVEQVDGWRRLHCEDGPTLESDIENLYFWHGVLVPAFVVVRPKWITVKHILGEENAEVRRVMIERYGWDRFLTEAGTLLHSDGFGDLYRFIPDNDEPITGVVVVNSTHEPDGSFKMYTLQVHPELRPLYANDEAGRPRLGEPQELTARNAVASTFGLRGEEYRPMVQT